MLIPLEPGRTVRFVVENGQSGFHAANTFSADPTYYFSGRVYNARRSRSDTLNNGSFGFIAVTNGRIRGTIHTDDSAYQIESLDASTVSIVQTDWAEIGNIDEGALKPEPVAQAAQPSGKVSEMLFAPQQAAEATSSTTPTEVDIVVVYTTRALQRAVAEGQDYVGQSAFSVYYTNQIYENSGINARLRLVGIGTTDYAESHDMLQDVNGITPGHPDFVHSRVSDLRNQLRADIAIMVGDYSGPTHGVAWHAVDQHEVVNGPISFLPEWAFGIVDYDFMGRAISTFPHEVGHIYGAGHNPEDDNSNGGFYYGHGMRKVNNFCPDFICGNQWQTVMSYGQVTQIPYYSTPSISYNGDPIGSSSQRNVLVHNNYAYAVSRFRLPPAPPLSVDVQGPSTASAGSTVTYTAVVSSGQTSVQYVWRRRTADMDEDQPGTVVQTGGTTYTLIFNEPGFVSVEASNTQGEVAHDGVYTSLPYMNPCPKPTMPGCGPLDPNLLSEENLAVDTSIRATYEAGRLRVWLEGVEAAIEIEVYDLLGRRLAAQPIGSNSTPLTLALPSLPAGMYLVAARSAGVRTLTQTFVVQ
ncbi:MAG: hypothetical protein IAE99_12135 [Rhodothermales bacterium]|nr:hypothetical protein [Rhodothermales bacterium]